jgi:hypothetical protein
MTEPRKPPFAYRMSTAGATRDRAWRCLHCLPFVLLLLLATPAGRADDVPTRLSFDDADVAPLLRTDFFGIYFGGQKAGWARSSTDRTYDPNNPSFVYQSESHTQFKSGDAEQHMNLESR